MPEKDKIHRQKIFHIALLVTFHYAQLVVALYCRIFYWLEKKKRLDYYCFTLYPCFFTSFLAIFCCCTTVSGVLYCSSISPGASERSVPPSVKFSSKPSWSLTTAISGRAKTISRTHYCHILILLALLMHPVLLDQLLSAFSLVNPLNVIKY